MTQRWVDGVARYSRFLSIRSMVLESFADDLEDQHRLSAIVAVGSTGWQTGIPDTAVDDDLHVRARGRQGFPASLASRAF
jgi:hypothetical protein